MALVETLICGDFVVLGGDIMVILVSKIFRLRVIMEKKAWGSTIVNCCLKHVEWLAYVHQKKPSRYLVNRKDHPWFKAISNILL